MRGRWMAVPAACSLAFNSGMAVAQTCGFSRAFDRADERGTAVVHVYESAPDARIDGQRALLFVTPLKVNTDGTRISYNVDDPRARRLAINNIANAVNTGVTGKVAAFERVAAAGFPLPETWRVLSRSVIEADRRTGKPCVDAQRYLVSKTSEVAVDGGFARDGDCDQAKWLDALTVNALVLPLGKTQFSARTATTRTPVVAYTLGTRRLAFGLVGDKGPANELGEASVAMNRTLNGLANDDLPKDYIDAVRRFQAPRSAILLFPGETRRLRRPLTGAAVEAATKTLFDHWGGQQRLDACLREIPEAR